MPQNLFKNEQDPVDLFKNDQEPIDLFAVDASEKINKLHPLIRPYEKALSEMTTVSPKERQEMKSMALDSIPIVGGIKSAQEVYTGKDYFTEEPIPLWAKGLMIGGGLLGAGGVAKMILKRVGKKAPIIAKTVAQKLADHKKEFGIMPTKETINGWWLEEAKKIPKELDAVSKVDAMYDQTLKEMKDLKKVTPSDIGHELRRQFIDVSGNLKAKLLKKGSEGKRVVMRHDLIAGASPKAMKEYDDASKQIFKGLSRQDEEGLWKVINSRRTLEVDDYKPGMLQPKGLKAEHQKWLDSMPTEKSTALNKRADVYFQTMRKQLDKMQESGLIDEAGYKNLSQYIYSPRQYLKHLDPEISYNFGGNPITVTSSGVKALEGGSEGLLNINARELLSQVITRTEGRVFNNKANQELYKLATDIPDNGIVQIATKGQKKVPAGHSKISAMVDGKPVDMIMPNEFAKEWVLRDPAIKGQLATWISWLSGKKVLQAMATGYNPEFALTNFPRDVAHIFLTTDEYSSFIPKFGFQVASDLKDVAMDAIKRKGRWADYINEGGGMEFLTHQGQIKPGATGSLKHIQKALGWFGETSEIVTRLALRERALKNGLDPEMATWVARNYLDFSQGGSFAKALDQGIPYLNAGIQGTRGIARAAAQNPAKFTWKAAQIGTMASGLYLANRFQNPDAWAQISDRDKINNWIITTPFSYKDKDGTKKYLYFRIAKDQGQRVMASIFENMMAKSIGDEVNAEQIAGAVQDFIPIIPTDVLPPTIDAIMGYTSNKDFWRNEDIWRGPDVNPSAESTRYTHPAFKTAGKATGMSPERMKYALSQYFTRGNIYTSMVGYGWNKLFKEMSEEERGLVTQEIIMKQPGIRRFMRFTDPIYQHGKKIKETDREISTQKYLMTQQFDEVSQKFYDGKIKKKDVVALAKSFPVTERNRLMMRHQRRGRIQDLPDKRWWLNLAAMKNPEAKAVVYHQRWLISEPKERDRIEQDLKRIPGISGDKFYYKLKKLKQKPPK